MLINDYRIYLEDIKRKPKTINIYVSKLQGFLDNGYTEADLCRLADVLYKAHLKGGNMYDPRDSGNTSAALKNLVDFLASGYAAPADKTSREILEELKKTKGTPFEPYELPRTGYDPDGGYINYDHLRVNEEMMVPGLTCALEGEYEAIYALARDLFCPPDVKFERIPVILSPICYYADYEKGNAQEIKRVLDNDRFIDRLLGRFFGSEEPYIEIYYRNISSSNFDEYVKKLAQCLAHEYMHYVQYKYCEFLNVKKKSDPVILESMADFFSVLYSVKRIDKVRERIAKARYDLWQDRFISLWPYAQALRIYTVGGNTMQFSIQFKDYKDHGSIEKVSKILRSLDKPTDALDILMNS